MLMWINFIMKKTFIYFILIDFLFLISYFFYRLVQFIIAPFYNEI